MSEVVRHIVQLGRSQASQCILTLPGKEIQDLHGKLMGLQARKHKRLSYLPCQKQLMSPAERTSSYLKGNKHVPGENAITESESRIKNY